MKLDWGHGTEKSFGNGVFRVTLKETVVAIVFISAFFAGVQVFKTVHEAQAAKLNSIESDLDSMKGDVREVKDRVLVLETVAKTTRDIRARVRNLQDEEVFGPGVTQIKVKQPKQ